MNAKQRWADAHVDEKDRPAWDEDEDVARERNMYDDEKDQPDE